MRRTDWTSRIAITIVIYFFKYFTREIKEDIWLCFKKTVIFSTIHNQLKYSFSKTQNEEILEDDKYSRCNLHFIAFPNFSFLGSRQDYANIPSHSAYLPCEINHGKVFNRHSASNKKADFMEYKKTHKRSCRGFI